MLCSNSFDIKKPTPKTDIHLMEVRLLALLNPVMKTTSKLMRD